MNHYDLLIKNGRVHTAVESFEAEIGVSEGKINAIGKDLGNADRVIDAKECWSFPEESTRTATSNRNHQPES